MSTYLVYLTLAFGSPTDAPSMPPLNHTARDEDDDDRLGKGQKLVLGGALAYGIGVGLQWSTAAAAGQLGNPRPGIQRTEVMTPYTVGMVFGGVGQLEGVLLTSLGSERIGKDSRGKGHLSRPLRATGAVFTSLGAGAVLGTGLMWPVIRERCPIGAGCGLAGVNGGAAVLTAGTSMLAYGHAVRPDERRRGKLPKKTQLPLIAGTVLVAEGYLSAAIIGMRMWQSNQDSAAATRVRNQMLIPAVGPWIVAAGPDAPLPLALVASGLGALQIGGGVALAIGSIRAGRHHRRSRAQVRVVPNGTGVSIVGRF